MKKNLLPTTLLTLAALLGLAHPAQADDRAQAVEAVLAIYRQQLAGLESKDADRAYAGYAPAFLSIDAKGQTRSLAQCQQQFQASLPRDREIKVLRFEVLEARLQGPTLVIQYYQKTHLELVKKKEPDPHKTDPYVSEGRYEDTWQRGRNGWQLVQQRALATKFEEDWSQLSPEERRIKQEAKMATLKQQMELFNYANHAHACTMGWGYQCRGW